MHLKTNPYLLGTSRCGTKVLVERHVQELQKSSIPKIKIVRNRSFVLITLSCEQNTSLRVFTSCIYSLNVYKGEVLRPALRPPTAGTGNIQNGGHWKMGRGGGGWRICIRHTTRSLLLLVPYRQGGGGVIARLQPMRGEEQLKPGTLIGRLLWDCAKGDCVHWESYQHISHPPSRPSDIIRALQMTKYLNRLFLTPNLKRMA